MLEHCQHGLNQATGRNWGRGVNPGSILEAIKSPKKIVDQAWGAKKYVGSEATVILNSEGKIITTFGKARDPQIWNENGVIQKNSMTYRLKPVDCFAA